MFSYSEFRTVCIVSVGVVLKSSVAGDVSFDNLSGSHLQGQAGKVIVNRCMML